MYEVDEYLLEQLKIGLEMQDQSKVDWVIEHLVDRTSGQCFCSALSANDCVCGAWDGIWDEDDE